jgi:hypothetical protein
MDISQASAKFVMSSWFRAPKVENDSRYCWEALSDRPTFPAADSRANSTLEMLATWNHAH